MRLKSLLEVTLTFSADRAFFSGFVEGGGMGYRPGIRAGWLQGLILLLLSFRSLLYTINRNVLPLLVPH
jgi:hypothetical protein